MLKEKTKVISIFNNKGGVGKTTITWNLGDALARQGKKVLLIDFDPQSNLSLAVLGEKKFLELLPSKENPFGSTIRAYLQNFLQNVGEQKLYKHQGDNTDNKVDLVASDAWLNVYSDSINVGSDLLSGTGIERFAIINRIIETANSQNENNFIYDYVLIDLPPSFNNLVRAALYSSNYLIIPCTSDTFCSYCVRLIGETLPRFIKEWQLGCEKYNDYNPHDDRYNILGKPVFLGWIFNGYDTRKPKNEQKKQTIAADKVMESKISKSVQELLKSLKKIKEYDVIPKKPESGNFYLGGIEDMNVLIQNSMWRNCPIAKLSEYPPVRNLQNRSWSPQQKDLINELTNAFQSIANNIIEYCK